MKRFMYAVMLLLGLSMVSVSCSSSPEKDARRDAKAYCRTLDKGDAKAEQKAVQQSDEHAAYYDSKGEYSRYRDAYTEYLKNQCD